MLARSLTRYRFFDLRGIDPAEQLAALRGQLAAWQPFPEARYWVQWLGGRVCVHACSTDSIAELSPRAAVWPEACLHPPMTQGLRLVECVEGVEGQCWGDGLLRASQWWPAAPDSSDWVSFVRASGSPPAPMPAVEALEWQPPKIKVQALERLGQAALAPARTLGGALLIALLGFSAYTAHALWEAQQAADAASMELQAVRTKAEPIVKLRERAGGAAKELEAMLKPLWAPQPLDVLEHLARQLPKGAVLREFELQGLEVRMVLETPPELARSQLFEALESGGWFTKVTEQAGGRGGISLQFRLNGMRAPLAAAQAATGVKRRSTDEPAVSSAPPAIPPGLK